MKDAVGIFFAMQTQWRWVGAGLGGVIRTGLDYGALRETAENCGVAWSSSLFDDIRTLELAALDAWSRKR